MLYILLSLTQVQSNFCSGYGCSADPYASSVGQCILQQGSKYSLSICEDEYYSYCQPGNDDQICSLPPSHDDLNISYVGEPCVYDRNCLNSICKDNFCVVDNPSNYCTDSSMCKPGYFCNMTQCIKLISPTSSTLYTCLYDSECDYDSGCLGGQCHKYFTIEAGNTVDICPGGLNFLCVSGACQIDRNQGSIICLNETKTDGRLPKACSGDADCVIESFGFSYTTGCVCGINPESQAYCKLAPGDKDFVNLINFFKDWLSSDNVKNCSTERRASDKCIKTYASSKDYAQYNYYLQKVNYYPQIQGNDECIKQIFTNQYWQAYETYLDYQTKKEDDSSAEGLVVLFGIWLLV